MVWTVPYFLMALAWADPVWGPDPGLSPFRGALPDQPDGEDAQREGDEATFVRGTALLALNRDEEAMAVLRPLLSESPPSAYVAAAYLVVGDYYANLGNTNKALQAYKGAVKDKASRNYPYALYRLGWVEADHCQFDRALSEWRTLVGLQAPESDPDAARWLHRLQDAARRDVLYLYAENGGLFPEPDALLDQATVEGKSPRLAMIYAELGHFDQAITIWRRLLAEGPLSPEAPAYQYRIIAIYQRLGSENGTRREMEALRDTYGESSAWAEANAANPDAVLAVSELLARALADSAVP